MYMFDIFKKQLNSLKEFLDLKSISIKTKNQQIFVGDEINEGYKYRIKIDENTNFEASRDYDFNEKEISVLNFFVKLIFDSIFNNGYFNLTDFKNGFNINGFDKSISDSNLKLRDEILKILLETIKMKDEETFEHSQGVSYYAKHIAKEFFEDEEKIKNIEIASLLHDIGKISIKEQILFKPSKLREDEFEMIKKHPEVGYKILSKSEILKDLANYVLLHHEWVNGMGYPFGIKGDKIPIEAQIISIADYIEVNLQGRNYLQRKTIGELIKDLENLIDVKFKKEVVEAAIKILKIEEDGGKGVIY